MQVCLLEMWIEMFEEEVLSDEEVLEDREGQPCSEST